MTATVEQAGGLVGTAAGILLGVSAAIWGVWITLKNAVKIF